MTDDRAGIIRLATEIMGCCAVVKSCSAEYENLMFTGAPNKRFAVYHEEGGPIHLCGDFMRAGHPWNPFESHADAYELEARIPEDKRDAYCCELWAIVVKEPRGGWNSKYAGYWYMIHATPRQRSEAALAVLAEGK